MAISEFGPQGLIRGRLGALCFYVRDGKQLVRKRGKMTKPPTEAQLKVRKQLAVVVVFLKPLLSIIKVGFLLKAKEKGSIPYSMAVQYNRNNAVSGEYPDIYIDYSKVRLTAKTGRIYGPGSPGVSLVSAGLKFTWNAEEDRGWSGGSDQLMMVVYFPESKSVAYCLYGAKRSAGEDVLPLTETQLTTRMEVYVSCVSADRKAIADSMYLGRLN